MARLALGALLVALPLLALACAGGSQQGGASDPVGAADAFLRSLGGAARGEGVQAAAPEVAEALRRGIAQAAAGSSRLEVEVQPLGPPRFNIGGDERRRMGIVVGLSMREVGPDGSLRRSLQVDRYDVVLTVERRGGRWQVTGVSGLPWIGDTEGMETGGCPLVEGRNHHFQRLREERRQDVLQLPATEQEMRDIERAWRCYWLVTSHAFRSLDDSLLPLVSGGRQLELDREMVRVRSERGIALEEEAWHRSPVLVQYIGDRATVDEWFDGRGRGVAVADGSPLADWDYKAGHLTFRLEKEGGRWVVVGHAYVIGPDGEGQQGG